MQEELTSLSLSATYEVDESFDSDKFIKLRLRVCHDGVNPNSSSFTIENMDKAKDSMKNIPILAHVIFDEDGQPQFGAHDTHIEEDKVNEGEYKVIYDEQPIGGVPETNNHDIQEYQGRNYVFTDAFVWKDYSNYSQAIIERDKNIKLSMEIIVDSYLYDNKTKTFNIIDYRYKGITLLGNDYGTGMIDALATTESFSDNKQKFFNLMSDLKEEIIKNQSSSEVDNTNKTFSQEDEKEVNVLNEEKNKLLEKYNLSIDKLDFEIEDMSIEDLEAKLKEFTTEPQTTSEPAKVSFSATYNQKREALRNALDSVYVKDENGDIIESTYYYVMDFTDEHVFVEKDYWNEAGDFEETHGRFPYSFNEEDLTATITGDWEEMFLMWLTADEKQALDAERTQYTTITSEFNTYKETYKTPETDVEVLREFQTKALSEQRKADEKKVFEMEEFEKLSGNEEFETLKENAGNYTIEALTDKCFSILGKATTNFSAKAKSTVKVSVDVTGDANDEPYGGLFTKYSKSTNK